MGTIKLNKNNIKAEEQAKTVVKLSTDLSSNCNERFVADVETNADICKIAEKDSGFVEEIKELRTENETVYRRNDGTCRKIISSTPIRYRDENGNYKDISNKLVDNGQEIVNEANSFKVRFNKNAHNGKIFDLQRGGKKLTLSTVGSEKTRGHVCGCKCELCAGTENIVTATLDDGTEIQYVTLSDRIKENIIIKERQESYEYNFTLDIGDLIVEEGEYNDLLLKDRQTGETEFRIPAPYMYDANKKRSNKVSYEIDVNGSELGIKVVADAEFINAEDRAFPVTIDPQIIAHKNVYVGITVINKIEYTDDDDDYTDTVPKAWHGDSRKDIECEIQYEAPNSIMEGNIVDAKLVMRTDTGSGKALIICTEKNGERIYGTGPSLLEPEIFDAGWNDTYIEFAVGVGGKGKIIITCDSSRFSGHNFIVLEKPYFVVDYIEVHEEHSEQVFEANNPPLIKDFEFTDKATGHIYARYGTLATSFKSFGTDDFVLPLNISHCHKVGLGRTEIGSDWRLSLNRELKLRGANGDTSEGYLYIDEFGDKYILSENYYYADGDNVYTVSKQSINIDINGNMTYNGKPVYKYQTYNGLTLIPEIKDFINYDLVQQKSDEMIQLEDYVNQLKISLKDYVIVNDDSGTEVSALSSLTRAKYDLFIKNLTSWRLLLSANEAAQLRSLYLSKKQLETHKTQLNQQLAECEQLLAKYNAGIPENNFTYETNSQGHKNAEAQQKILTSQISDANNQYLEIGKQIELFKAQSKEKESVVKEIFLKYFSKEQELKLLVKQMPVNYLRDEKGVISGFNSEGNLVLICDSYNNFVIIVYDTKNRISEIYDSQGKTMNFEYQNDLLYRITDNLGRRVQYSYKGFALIKVVFADESFLEFEYQGDKSMIRSVMSSTDLQAKVSVDDSNRVTNIATNSKPVTIGKKVSKEKDSFSKTIANITVDYDRNDRGYARTMFTSKDNKTERYTFNSASRVTLSEKADNDFVKTVTTLTYDTNGNVVKSVVQHDIDGTEEESSTYNVINQLKSKESGWKNISDTVKVKTSTSYSYDGSGNLIEEVATMQTDVSGTVTPSIRRTKYSYNPNGSLILTESYIEGEEDSTGKYCERRVYDDNGNVTKTISWNSLDSTSKFYTESDRAENGQVKADRDETGELSAEYEYVDGTNVVNSVKYTNGSKFAYGRNPNTFEITGITQSTADGEANATDIAYNYGLPVEVKSGNTTLGYTYDYARRKTAITVNGATQATYSYKDYTYNENQNKCTFGEQTTVLSGGSGATTTILQSKTGVLDSDSGRIKVTETTKFNGTEMVKKEYDVNGRLSSVKDKVSGTRTYTYDSYDNVTNISGVGPVENYTYNGYGLLTQKALTGAVTQTYSYAYKDNLARSLESVSVSGYTFKSLRDVNGRNTGREISNGANKIAGEYITYRKVGDHATNMPATVWFGSGKNIADSIKYKYDSCGNINEIIVNGHKNFLYQYDSLNRLIREDNKKLGITTVFTYDSNGNITERCVYDYTSKSGEELSELECTHYSYDYDGDKLVSYNGEGFVYDNLGNPTTYRGKSATWLYGKLLASYNGVTFTYNGIGSRASKGNITFTYDSDGRLIKQSNGLEFIYDMSGVAGVKYNNAQYFYRKDAQGNIIAILDSNGNAVVYYEYDAWGNHAVVDANGNDVTSGIGALNPFRYRGYYYDTETELYYLQTRYYDPELGRFISQDSLEYADPETINGINLYAYCGNNPVMNVDPVGTFAILSFLFGLAIGAFIGAVVGAVSYVASEAISAAFTGTWSWSWGMFAGSIIGGALGGALTFAFPIIGIVGGAAITGGLSTGIGMALENAFGEANHSIGEIIVSSLIMIGVSAFFANITSKIRIPGFTGRGSISQVARQINTKLLNGTISSISRKTFGKILAYNLGYSVFNTLASGLIDAIDYIRNLLRNSYRAEFPS